MKTKKCWVQTFQVEDWLTVEGATANAVFGNLSQAYPFMVFSSPLLELFCPDQNYPGSSFSTSL